MQTSIAQSTGEAEYVALSKSIRQVLPLRTMLLDMKRIVAVPQVFSGKIQPILTWEDNTSALSLANNHRLTNRNKFYNVRFHFFWSHVEDGEVVVRKVDTSRQQADYLTKGLAREIFESCRRSNQGW